MKQQLYGHLPPISKTIQVRRTRHGEHCWRSKTNTEMTFFYGPVHMNVPVLTDQQVLIYTSSMWRQDVVWRMDDRDGWRERESRKSMLINTRLAKAWTAINKLLVIWKSDLTDKLKHSFFQAAVVLILLYGSTIWTLTKHMKEKLNGNYTRMLWAILNKSWRQHPTKQQLYRHLSPITKTIQIRQTRHAGHCWKSKNELISNVLLQIPSHRRAKIERPARTYIQQLCADTWCSLEDLPGNNGR